MKSFAIAIVATLGFQLATVPAGHAQNAFQCSETISDGRTINGSVVVPANRICTLTNVTVVGNVQVGTGADLNVSGQGGTVKVIGNVRVGTGAALSVMGSSDLTITIDGYVVADQCYFVRFENTMRGAISVEGNVNIQNCTNGSGAGSYFGLSRLAAISYALTIPLLRY
ncbi:MAG: hypothetical protein JO139_10085 [Alphaproteobacteria bacterium]|nr:hypothetical protein [Alphaproteobacteria bacterium]